MKILFFHCFSISRFHMELCTIDVDKVLENLIIEIIILNVGLRFESGWKR